MISAKELADYRSVIRQGFALAAAPEARQADTDRWVREEGIARALLGPVHADRIVDEEAQALRLFGICPWCGGRAETHDNTPQEADREPAEDKAPHPDSGSDKAHASTPLSKEPPKPGDELGPGAPIAEEEATSEARAPETEPKVVDEDFERLVHGPAAAQDRERDTGDEPTQEPVQEVAVPPPALAVSRSERQSQPKRPKWGMKGRHGTHQKEKASAEGPTQADLAIPE